MIGESLIGAFEDLPVANKKTIAELSAETTEMSSERAVLAQVKKGKTTKQQKIFSMPIIDSDFAN